MKLKEYVNKNDKAIIVLHEIYGINKHIENICSYYHSTGYDIFCPDLLDRNTPFDYSEKKEAYCYFTDNIGFDAYQLISYLIEQLKIKYEKVFLMGFSVGATLAWRCTTNVLCDGMIGFYGSRIRDYINVIPKCPVLLIFAEDDSFDVVSVAKKLRDNQNITAVIFEGKHGFLDSYSENFNPLSCEKAMKTAEGFLSDIHKSG